MEEKVIIMGHVSIENQLANIFTKALDGAQFEKLRSAIEFCMIDNL